MSDVDELEDQREKLNERLPKALQADWTVIPKPLLKQVFVIGLLMGAAFALTVVGFVLDMPNLRLAMPIVFFGLMALRKWWPWWRGDASEDQLRRAVDGESTT